MTLEQKRVASWIAVGLLAAGVIALAWLTYLASTSNFVDNPSGDDPKLHFSWRIALWFIELGTALKVAFASLITIITVGIGSAAEIYKSTRQIALIASVCLMGIALAVVLMVLIGDDANGEILRYFSKYDTLPELESAADTFFWAAVGWFSFFLASQLGIRVSKEGGAVRNLLARLFG